MQRTVLYIPDEIQKPLDVEVEAMNVGQLEKPWDRSKLIRTILRNYIHSKEKNERCPQETA